jgi:hypothetical protein
MNQPGKPRKNISIPYAKLITRHRARVTIQAIAADTLNVLLNASA